MKAKLAIFLTSSLLLSSCVSSGPKVSGLNEHTQRNLIKMRQYPELIKAFESDFKKGAVKDKDYLLLRLNYATVLHYNGDYKQSNAVLKECQQLVDNYDTTASEEVLGFVANGKTKKFKLEDFEVLNISFLKSLNSLLDGNLDDAIIEMKRMDRIGRMLSKESGNNLLEQTQYTTYLSAILFEARRLSDDNALDSAYIDYKRVQKVYPRHPYIAYDLWRTAFLNGRSEDLKAWEKLYPIPLDYKQAISNKELVESQGELVIIFSNGLAPQKDSHPDYKNVPVYIPQPSLNEYAHIKIDDEDYGHTVPLANLSSLMIKDLENRYATKVGVEKAKEIVGAVLTVGLGPAGMLFSSLNTAFKGTPDTRAWDMLPANYQIARIPLRAGNYELEISLKGSGGVFPQTVNITRGRKTLIFLSVHE